MSMFACYYITALSLTDINAWLVSIWKGVTHLKMDADKVYTYMETLAMHTIS